MLPFRLVKGDGGMASKLKYNPFMPGSIVSPGMFSGRVDCINSVEKAIFQTRNGNPTHFIVTGERGIGKSSLFFAIHKIADGTIPGFNNEPFNFIVLSIELDPSTTFLDIVLKIDLSLAESMVKLQEVKSFFKNCWSFIKDWEILGVKYTSKETNTRQAHNAIDELVDRLGACISSAASSIDGILILIDEADKPTKQANLGEFCKLFTEKITKKGKKNICLGISGLPQIIKKMKESHASSPRIFQIHELGPLTHEESLAVINRGLEEAESVNKFPISIEDVAAKFIAESSEGYPNFIQQFSYCAFDLCDKEITYKNALLGAYGKNGAIDQLGKNYFSDVYFDQIGSNEYRKVLKCMAGSEDRWIEKKKIAKETGLKKTTLTNALSTMKKKGIVLAKRGTRGEYRLPTKSFSVWIRAFASDESKKVVQQESGDVGGSLFDVDDGGIADDAQEDGGDEQFDDSPQE